MLTIHEYTDEYVDKWDSFVMEESVNGTFLQTRRFLEYHSKSKFKDASILVYDVGKIVAVCPACIEEEDEKKVFFSHKGSTFGGLVISKKYYDTRHVIELIETLDIYLKGQGYHKCILKITPDLFSTEESALLLYCLQYEGYGNYSELNTYVNLNELPSNVREAFDRNKNRNLDKCDKYNLTFREIRSDKDVADFYNLLTINLQKYGIAPIHSYEDILMFKNERLIDETRFFGVFQGEKQLAGGMMFIFKQTNTIHAQNLSSDYTFTEFSPITYLYAKIIEMARNEGYNRLSWGISTEEHGKVLNTSLVRNKESYGSKYAINYTWYKEY